MILDMNIKLEGIDEAFLDNLEEMIEDTRVEYFILNPKNPSEVEKSIELCSKQNRFKYSLRVAYKNLKDENCVAFRVADLDDLDLIDTLPLVIDSNDLSDDLIETINSSNLKGVVLSAKESDTRLKGFAFAISHHSLSHWSQEGITKTDYNQIALQSDYPEHSYDDLLDGLLKDISDLTFRAEQTIAAGGTRTALKIFGLM